MCVSSDISICINTGIVICLMDGKVCVCCPDGILKYINNKVDINIFKL